MNQANIVVIDDEEGIRKTLKAGLDREDYNISLFSNGKDALEFIAGNRVDVIVSDIKMSPMDGIELLKKAKDLDKNTVIILITAYSSTESSRLAIQLGAFDYVEKPFKMDHIRFLVQRGVELRATLQENVRLKKTAFPEIVGRSPQIEKVFHLIKLVAPKDSTVLVSGESGTGKELFSRLIHNTSPRRSRPFVVINCGAIPENLLESELFGHKKGSFTGAVRDKTGLFQEAHTGSIFLDEISALPLSLQVKMLRVLQEKEIRKVGDTQVSHVDVRIIAASNENLSKLVEQKKFRQDLYYRLSVVPIQLPPLHAREGDIPLLIDHFLNAENDSQDFTMTSETKQKLMDYHWPGNVRELENIIERLKILSQDKMITPEMLPENFFRDSSQPEAVLLGHSLKAYLEFHEKRYISQVLQECAMDKKEAAGILKIDLATLYRKIEKLQIL